MSCVYLIIMIITVVKLMGAWFLDSELSTCSILFRISCTPGIFQSHGKLTEGYFRSSSIYLDDILVTGLSEEEHVSSLKQITGGRFTTKQKKVSVLASAVTYLGYQTDSEGLHPTDEKLNAVKLAPEPTSVTELKAYLGLLTYYGSFTSPPISYTSAAVIAGTKNMEMLISPTVSLTFHEKHWMRPT